MKGKMIFIPVVEDEHDAAEMPICPREFAKRMQKYADELHSPHGDMESVHRAADDLMLEVLEALGYGEGTAIFGDMPKWYA